MTDVRFGVSKLVLTISHVVKKNEYILRSGCDSRYQPLLDIRNTPFKLNFALFFWIVIACQWIFRVIYCRQKCKNNFYTDEYNLSKEQSIHKYFNVCGFLLKCHYTHFECFKFRHAIDFNWNCLIFSVLLYYCAIVKKSNKLQIFQKFYIIWFRGFKKLYLSDWTIKRFLSVYFFIKSYGNFVWRKTYLLTKTSHVKLNPVCNKQKSRLIN